MPNFEIQDLIDLLPKAFIPDNAKGVEASIQIHADGEGGGDWVINIRDGKCDVEKGTQEKTDLYVAANTQVVKGIFTGEVNGMAAFMKGDIEFKGSMGLAMKLSKMFSQDERFFSGLK